ncbi:disulfide bond formation protein DsbA [Serinibacter arcticus]|uniref:Disulfide bond formation protein DsbA n=1 Tax=Serinibacter arcticus TaxID=1655435 RepID=A0A2U1ZY86_9MICO|nr:thioredoxin domain-containing protein [Serinibacter arcticus]PWD51893.1 disulfide bond formation protein DsbA [Serinibacter arcticus]
MSTPKQSAKQTKDARREAARAQAEKMRRAQDAREKRSRNILIGVLGGIVVLVVAVGIVIWSQSQRTLLDAFDGNAPSTADNHAGITVGAEGEAGTVNDGAPVMQVYVDFMCPYCGDFEEANAADLEELRAAGDLTVTYHIMSNLDQLSQGTNFSTRAANAAATVANDSPEHFVAFVEAMFVNQPEENTAGLSDEEMAAIAVEVGVPQSVADTFSAGTYNEWVGVGTSQANREGVRGTPTVKIDGDNLPETVNYYNAGALAAYLTEQGAGDVSE